METTSGGVKITARAIVAIACVVALAIVGAMALDGDRAAQSVLLVLGTVTLICIGAGLVVTVLLLQGEQEQKRFRENAKENIILMQQQLRAQNMATQGALLQGRLNQQQLPGPAGSLLFDPAMFDALDDEPAELPAWTGDR